MVILTNTLILDIVLGSIQVDSFIIQNFDFGKNVILFGVVNNHQHVLIIEKYILVLGEGSTQQLHDTTMIIIQVITESKKYFNLK